MGQYILSHEKVHYSDLTTEFNISRPTVTKYLNLLSESIADTNVKLIRDKTSGIYFEGDTTDLQNVLNEETEYIVPDTPDDRQMFIIARLIFRKNRVTINQLCQQLYVSKRTVESDLTKVRNFIADNGGSLINNNGSLSVVLPEKIKYPFLIDVIHKFWGNKLMTSNHENVIFPPMLNQYFEQSQTKQVFKIVDEFISQHDYKLTDYEYETLVIYLILQLSLSKNSNQNQDSPTQLETETLELSKKFHHVFHYHLNIEQLTYLNNFIILIKLENRIPIIHNEDFSDLRENIQELLDDDFDEQLLEGLYQHLSGALRRYKFGMKASNPYIEQIKRKFPLSFEEALKLVSKLDRKLDTDLSEDEVAFVALHFESHFERKRTPDAPVTAVIVCNTGIGTSRLLEEKINQNMRDQITIERILRSYEVGDSNISEDLIISTVPLENIEKPHVLVSPFLTDRDKQEIKRNIDLINSQTEAFGYFLSLFKDNLIFIEDEKLDYQEAIQKMTTAAIESDLANNDLTKAAINRENISSTAVDNIALPHADTQFVKQPFIAIMISKKGIKWMNENVKVAFFMGMNDQTSLYIRKIYHYLNEIIEDKERIYELENSQSTTEVLKILTGDK